MSDLISRQAAIDALAELARDRFTLQDLYQVYLDALKDADMRIRQMPSAQQEQRWIPVSDRLPENTEPVNITWVNRKPEPYYADIKDKPFTATGHYCNGKWWWYSALCQDYLDEYGKCEMDEVDKDIEVIAWMPLPEPYKKGGNDE